MLSQRSSRVSSSDGIGHILLVGSLKVFTVESNDLIVGPAGMREAGGGARGLGSDRFSKIGLAMVRLLGLWWRKMLYERYIW